MDSPTCGTQSSRTVVLNRKALWLPLLHRRGSSETAASMKPPTTLGWGNRLAARDVPSQVARLHWVTLTARLPLALRCEMLGPS
jgi:hypothetical protein